jgi:hypothetical protein
MHAGINGVCGGVEAEKDFPDADKEHDGGVHDRCVRVIGEDEGRLEEKCGESSGAARGKYLRLPTL